MVMTQETTPLRVAHLQALKRAKHWSERSKVYTGEAKSHASELAQTWLDTIAEQRVLLDWSDDHDPTHPRARVGEETRTHALSPKAVRVLRNFNHVHNAPLSVEVWQELRTCGLVPTRDEPLAPLEFVRTTLTPQGREISRWLGRRLETDNW